MARILAQQNSLKITASAPAGAPVLLIELRPYQTYEPGRQGAVVWKGVGRGELESWEIPRFDGSRDRLYSKFQLVEAKTRQPLGPAHYVDDLSALPVRDFDFPWPQSIKGLQVQDVDDAITLEVKYAGINVMVPSLIDRSNSSDEVWEVDGGRIPLNRGYIGQLDAQFKKLTDAGINVTAILLNGVPTQPDPTNPFIHTRTDLAGVPFHLGAFNTTDGRGLRYYRAALEYLANRYSDPEARHGWVSGYIIGNEVQAHWEGYNIGRMPLEEFVKDYGLALRVAYLATRRFHAKLRIYGSLEHHWNTAIRYSPPFMYCEILYFDSFPKEIAARQRLNGPFTQGDETVGNKILFYPYVHSFAQLVPPDRYFAEHSEYFSLVKGQRTNATVHPVGI